MCVYLMCVYLMCFRRHGEAITEENQGHEPQANEAAEDGEDPEEGGVEGRRGR
jgi:hypothetical protein